MRPLGIALACLLLACAAHADDGADWDALLYRATRYGDTAQRRAEKAEVRKALWAEGPRALRELMARVHCENVMLGVIAHELVVDGVPASNGVPVLAEFLDAEQDVARRSAVYLLGFYPCPDTGVVARVRAALAEEKARGAALRTLGRWGDRAVRAEAERLLREDPQERVRAQAANTLRDLREQAALPALIEALGDPVYMVRFTAARAVATFGDAAHRPLRDALETAEGQALRLVVRLLGELRVGRAERALARRLPQADDALRADLAAALYRIDPDDAPGRLRGYAVKPLAGSAQFAPPSP